MASCLYLNRDSVFEKEKIESECFLSRGNHSLPNSREGDKENRGKTKQGPNLKQIERSSPKLSNKQIHSHIILMSNLTMPDSPRI